MLAANRRDASDFGAKGQLALQPARGFSILTCMDARIDPAKLAGLSEGDAHVIRNAGGRASDDAIRSLVVSHRLLGTRDWLVIHHTGCGMELFLDRRVRLSGRDRQAARRGRGSAGPRPSALRPSACTPALRRAFFGRLDLFRGRILGHDARVNAKVSSGRRSRKAASGKGQHDESAAVDSAVAKTPERKASARPRVAPNSGDVLGAAELARHVAEALRQHRKTQDLSLDELAQKSGVSRAALSQIEGARTNPTLAVLWKIAVGLGVPFQQLLGTPSGGGPKVLRAGDSPPLRSANGQMESRLLSPGGAPPGIEVYELKLVPKGSYNSEPHSRGTLETLVVMTGTLKMIVDGEAFELATGDSILFNADVPHTYESRSSHPTRCINVITYPRGG